MQLSFLSGKGLFFLALFSLLFSCQRFFIKNDDNEIPNDTDCKEYIQSIPTFWEYQEEGYYRFKIDSSTFLWHFVQKTNECLKEYSVKSLKEVFGKPNEETDSILVYYTTKQCLTKSRDCLVQEFNIKDGFFVETLLIRPSW